MAHLGEHQGGRRADVDLLERHSERLRQRDGVVLGALAGGEAGQGERQDVAAWTAFAVHGLGRHDQRVGGVQPAGDTDDDLGKVQRPQALLKAGDLDVVTLVAVLLQPDGVVGHEREPLHLAAQADVPGGWAEPETDAPERVQAALVVPAVVVEGTHPQPLGAQEVEVDVGYRTPGALGETLRLGEQPAVLVDHRLAVPGQIGAGLALTGRRVDIRRQTARGCRAGQQFSVLGAADGDRTAGEVGQHGGTGKCGLRTRWHRHEHVLADLHVEHQTCHIVGGEQQVGAERQVVAEQPDRSAHIVTRRHLTALIELPIGREIRLDRHPEDPAAVDHHGRVVDAVQMSQGRPHHQHRKQIH